MGKYSYAQVSSKNIGNILKIKKNFSELLNKKIEKINKTIFGKADKPRSKINIMTKGPSRKQIIIPMTIDNTNKFMLAFSKHITNLNHSLKSIKTDLMVDFICIDHWGLIVISNKVAFQSEISIISKYIKNYNNINTNDIQDAHLPQSKSYLKILSIPYVMEGTNIPIKSNIIESLIKMLHIFNNVNFASKLCIAKVSLKSDMAIIWLDIWNSQSSSMAKKLINHYFNVGSFVATIRGTNMNPSVPQCKNCWKWGYTTFACHLQDARCLKCNSLHKTKHYHYFAWCYKTNFKINPSHLEIKQGEPCPHSFKYINWKGNH